MIGPTHNRDFSLRESESKEKRDAEFRDSVCKGLTDPEALGFACALVRTAGSTANPPGAF